MKLLVFLICLVTIFSCNPAEEIPLPAIKKIAIQTQTDTLIVDKDTLDLPRFARTGSAIYYKSPNKKFDTPIIMIPGTGLSDYIFTKTPDYRDSWASIFSRAGYDVYIYNDPSLLIHETINYSKVTSNSKKWSKENSWKFWGMGLKYPSHFKNTRYPIEDYDSLVNSFPAHIKYELKDTLQLKKIVTSKVNHQNHRINTLIKTKNLSNLINKVGNCILLLHASASSTGYKYNQTGSNYIKGIISLEPNTIPVNTEKLKKYYTNKPILGIYGDYIEHRKLSKNKLAFTKMVDYINSKDGNAKLIDLPKEGINGNTHLMMQDDNNGLLAGIILEWIDSSIFQK